MVKYMPSPWVGLVGGVEFGGTGCVERLGYPVVVTAKELGIPVMKVAEFGLVIWGAS
jgi:hypothetical protein